MADADSSLDILIRLLADTKGADPVQKSCNPTKEGTSQLATETGKAAEKTDTFNRHGREMHELAGKLNHVVPALGEALKAALNPEAAGIIGLVIALELAGKLFE